MTTILLIEDDADARFVLNARLAAAFPHARVIAAESAEAGLELAAHSRPTVIVLDLRLGGMDGFAFARQVRELAEAPIVVLTGDGRPETRERALREGAAAFLLKPSGAADLCDVISTLLARDAGGEGAPRMS
jgi:CheY-like chemotaxis protein